MFNYKSILALGTMLLLPFSVFADTCATLPKCADLGFVYSASDCGSLNKLKCPFDDTSYFCSANTCKSVKVGTYEKCTEYCADDKNVCIAKRAFTCTEFLNSYCSYNIYNDGATISGTKTGIICLKGTVKNSGSLTLSQATVYDASLLYEACGDEMTGRAKLDLSYVTLSSYVNFYTDVDIDSVYFYPNSSNYWSASFYGDSNVTVYYQVDSTWANPLNLHFGTYGSEDDYSATSKVKVYCEGGSSDNWNPPSCSVYADNYYENHAVTLCGFKGSNSSASCMSGTCYSNFDFTCNAQENSSEMCSIDINGNTSACWY